MRFLLSLSAAAHEVVASYQDTVPRHLHQPIRHRFLDADPEQRGTQVKVLVVQDADGHADRHGILVAELKVRGSPWAAMVAYSEDDFGPIVGVTHERGVVWIEGATQRVAYRRRVGSVDVEVIASNAAGPGRTTGRPPG